MKPLPVYFSCLGCYHCIIIGDAEPFCELHKKPCAGKCKQFQANAGRR